MSDVFVSYAHSTATQAQAQAIAEALRALDYSVWIDEQLPAHRAFGQVIEEQLRLAKAVVVIWSADAVQSDWVLSEANGAREAHKLVQLRVDDTRLPMPFDQIQCTDLWGWTGDLTAPGWRKVVASLAELIGTASPLEATRESDTSAARAIQPRPARALGNLPAEATSFVGRDAEIAELVELLRLHRM